MYSGVGGLHAHENFASARETARIRANLGDDAIPFLQELGPEHIKGNVYTGMQNPDGTRGWRFDYDTRSLDKDVHLNRIHINWWYQPDPSNPKLRFRGMIPIDKATQDVYWDILSHFPRVK